MIRRRPAPTYWLARFWFLRGMGLLYLVGFLVLVNQYRPLLGSDGLLPVPLFFDQLRLALGWRAFLAAPSVFWAAHSDAVMIGCAWLGAAVSALVLLGLSHAGALALLWVLYASFVHAGQLFYGYGWEMMMIEAGFLAIFLCPVRDWRPFPKDSPPAEPVIWMLRWMLFRLMFGSGLIKLRGDACWRELSCLYYHFETQPIPNPLSWYFHNLPRPLLMLGTLANHFAELVVPWFVFARAPWRTFAGAAIVLFQLALILSGNLSWLNYLTIVIAAASFDDAALSRWVPRGLRPPQTRLDMGRLTARTAVTASLCVLVGVLSILPALNLVSSRQIMNGSFDPIGLVNTYGAFGSVGKERLQLVLEGTDDAEPVDGARWREYAFKCSPGDVDRRPCVVSPYQERLDWQVWFAGMQDPMQNPWLFHFLYKLLQGNQGAVSLLERDPFPGKPPKYIRATLFRYRFTRPADRTKAWWARERLGVYMPPLSLDNPYLKPLIDSFRVGAGG